MADGTRAERSIRFLSALTALTISATAALAGPPQPELFDGPVDYVGEQLNDANVGPSMIETWDDMVRRDLESQPLESLDEDAQPIYVLNPPLDPGPMVRQEVAAIVGENLSGVDFRSTAPTLAMNFIGPRNFDSGFRPPDTMGVIGPNHFVGIINGNVSIYTRNGIRLSNISLASFFSGLYVGPYPYDPRIVFDPHSDRWIAIAADNPGGSNGIVMAVSSTDDPTGSWFKTRFQASTGADAGRWADFPTLGVDSVGIYVAANMFPLAAGSSASTFWAIDKAPLIAAVQSLGTITAFRGITSGFSIQPSLTFDTVADHYSVSAISSSRIRFYRRSGPITSPSFVSPGTVSGLSYSSPPNAPAQGSNTNINTVGDRLVNAVVRDGSLWTCHTINAGSNKAGARWYELDPVARTNLQSGTITDTTRSYYFPSICVNAQGAAVMGFSGSSSTEFVGTYYTGRLPTDPPGTMAAPVLLQAGLASYNALDQFGRNRWGDYSMTSIDPTNDLSIWTIQEYASTPANNWSTWIAQLNLFTTIFGDFDADGDVDLSDFSIFSLCFGGPNNPPAASCPAGIDADFDGDGDVDLGDFATFSLNFTGPL